MLASQVPSRTALIERARSLSAATLHEASGQTGALPSAIGPVSPGMQVCGQAVTVQCAPFDNLWLHRALYVDSAPGSVLVVSVGGAYEAGYWGEILSRAAQARGVAGLVIDGCVRDAPLLAQVGVAVFARGLCIRGTSKDPDRGGINGRLVIGEVEIWPQDLVVGDADGVVVIPADAIADVVDQAEARVKKEEEIVTKVQDGQRTLDIYAF
jgi:4-hydroxy-4-methyl-2-oxoglutarate aldolase